MIRTTLTSFPVKKILIFLWLIPCALLGATLSAVPALAQNPMGQWSAEAPWPTVGVHLAVLADGRVVTWGEDIPAPGATAFPTYVVTIPSGSTDTSAVQKLVINDDLFCA